MRIICGILTVQSFVICLGRCEIASDRLVVMITALSPLDDLVSEEPLITDRFWEYLM